MTVLLLEQLVNGCVTGAIYALIAAGLALVYGTMRILNLAQGEFVMLGGFATTLIVGQAGLPPTLGIPIAVMLLVVVAAVLQAAFIRPLLNRPGSDFSTIALTLGLSIALQNAAYHLWGERFHTLPYYVDGILEIGPIILPMQRVVILAGAVATLAALTVILKFTDFGRAIRATSQDREAAQVLGVNVAHVHMLTFALAAGLGALAAALLAPLTAVNPWMGAPLMLKGFVVIVLGGLGSFPGAIVAAFLLGIVESLALSVVSSEWRDVISFTLLVVCIWVRPWGLFGQAAR
jgi:branched-chain amino acid transport system permease protein